MRTRNEKENEGEAHREFAGAGGAPGEEPIGEVKTGDHATRCVRQPLL